MMKCENCGHALTYDYGRVCGQCSARLINPHWRHRQNSNGQCGHTNESGMCECTKPEPKGEK